MFDRQFLDGLPAGPQMGAAESRTESEGAPVSSTLFSNNVLLVLFSQSNRRRKTFEKLKFALFAPARNQGSDLEDYWAKTVSGILATFMDDI